MEIHMFLFITNYEGELKPEDKDVKEALEKIDNQIDKEFLVSKWYQIENSLSK